MRICMLAASLWLSALALNASAQEASDSVAVSEADSIAMLLVEPTVSDVVMALGDSLFLPPEGRARIFRDAHGVPHIYGATDRDAAFGFGYAQAEDHLIGMLYAYRQARGRLAEIAGKTHIETDYRAQLWRIHGVAGERYGEIPESTRKYIDAFVSGINHYISVHRRVLPRWVEEVSGVDVVALGRWIAFLYAEQTGFPELKQKGLDATLPALPGSNMWTVGPARSATGASIFVMDAQLPYDVPFRVYETRLVSDEGLNVSGATFWGLPVVFWGYNDQIAWGMTTNAIDVFDVYEERLDPANPRRYFYGDEKRRMSSRRVKLKVRGEPGQGVYEVERELLYTDHGPVYKTIDNWAYAARTSMSDLVDGIGQLLAMNKANSLDEFRQALARLELPVFNVMYADVGGNAFFVFNGRAPTRSEEFNWRAAVPGWTAETEWQGVLTFSRLPQLSNPASGFMQNCSVAPHLVAVESGLSKDAFPAYLGWGGFNHRGQRAFNWLLTHPSVSVADMQILARDDYLIDAEELKGLILRAYNRNWAEIYDPNGQVGMAIYLLRSWDNHADEHSRAMLLFTTWKARFDPLLSQVPANKRSDIGVLEKLALEALRLAVEGLTATYGRLDVPWGEVHTLARGEQRYAMGGGIPDVSALNQTWVRVEENGHFDIRGGTAFSMVVSLVEPIQAWTMLAFGNSEDLDSEHFADQVDLLRRNRFKRAVTDAGSLTPVLEKVLTVPFDKEEAELQSLRAFWRLRRKMDVPVVPVDSSAVDLFDGGPK